MISWGGQWGQNPKVTGVEACWGLLGSKRESAVATGEFQNYHSSCLVGSKPTAMGDGPVRMGRCQLQSRQKEIMAWFGVRSGEKAASGALGLEGEQTEGSLR